MKRAILSLLLLGVCLYLPSASPGQSRATIPRIEGRFINLVAGVCFCSGTIQAEIGYNPQSAFAAAGVDSDGFFRFMNLEPPAGADQINFRGSIFPRVANALSASFSLEEIVAGRVPDDSLLVFFNPPARAGLSPASLSGSLEGRVTDLDTGNPVPGAMVSMILRFRSGADAASMSEMEYSLSANGTGTYKLTESKMYRDIAGLHPGHFHLPGNVWITDLRALAPGYAAAPYTPPQAADFRMLSNTYTRDFHLERLEDAW